MPGIGHCITAQLNSGASIGEGLLGLLGALALLYDLGSVADLMLAA